MKKKKLFIGFGILVGLFIIVGIIAVATSNGEPTFESTSPQASKSQPAPPKSVKESRPIYLLQLLSTSYEREYDYIIMSGEIKNISNKNLENVMSVVSYYTADGSFVKSDDALIDYNPILPNQTSPFKVITTDNPAISSFKIEFKFLFGSTILTEDKR